MRRVSLALALSLAPFTGLMSSTASADTTPTALSAADSAPMPQGITTFRLENGMDVVVIEDHRAPVVTQMLWYRIGSADEVAGKSGIAHYLEHLMFKGTETVGSGEFSRIVAENGGTDNAFTSYDYTAYFQRIAADRLETVMKMEADRMANLRIGEEDWQAERQVVLEERAQRTDSSPSALFGEERNAAQYLNHPYGRPVIGWRDEIASLTRQDALDWYQAHYAPDNAALIIAGDVTAEAVRELAETYYGPIRPAGHSRDRARPQEPPQRAPRNMVMSDSRVSEPVFYRSILAAERNPGDQREAAVLTLLAELLGGSNQTSVLAQKLMLTGQAVSVGTYYDGQSVDPSSFRLFYMPADGVDTAEAESRLEKALQEYLAQGTDPEHLARVQNSFRIAQVYKLDSAQGRAYEYGQALSVGLTLDDVHEWPALLLSITPEEVDAAARKLLSSTARVDGWLLPAADPANAATGDPTANPATTTGTEIAP